MQTLAIMIGYALWFIFVISWNVIARPAPSIATAGPRRERLYALVISLGLTMIVVAPFVVARGGFQLWINPPLLAWAMLLIVAAGVALCWWARLHLGRLWSANVTHKEGHRVVDTGPYRLVRHPIYTGFIVMDLGLALLCGSALAFAGVAVITVGLWIKARLEEQFLIEELGGATYGNYQARTPMLVPRIPLPRMSLLSVFCLLHLALLGAAGTTVDIATPMPAPEWARLERSADTELRRAVSEEPSCLP